jgi:hypothetical protein
MAFARHQFIGSKRAGDAAVSEHMASVARQLGKPLEQVAGKPPDLPEGARLIWRAFLEMHNTRAGGFGPGPITYAEIDAWQRVMCSRLLPWEVDALRKVDDAFLQSAHEAPETVT